MALPDKPHYESDSETDQNQELDEPETVQLLDNESDFFNTDDTSTKNSNCAAIDIEKSNQGNDPGTCSTDKSVVGSPPDRLPSHLENYKTPHSQRRTVHQPEKRQQEDLPSDQNDQLQIPPVIKKWSGCVEVWLNMLYKEEASVRTRNARNPSIASIPLLPRMRAILVDWIMEVCEVYQLRRNTYYLALDYIDRFLTHRPSIPKTQLQLLGVTCLYLAAKLEEIYPPKMLEFAYVCDGACTEIEILTCERLVLNALGWDVNPMTPTSWLNLYMQIHSMPLNIPAELQHSSPAHLEIYFPTYSAYKFVRASHVMELFSLDPSYGRFSYNVIAAAAMHLVCDEESARTASGLTRDHIDLCLAHMTFFHKVLSTTNNPRLLSIEGKGGSGACSTGIPHSVAFMPPDSSFSPATNAVNAEDEKQHASYRAIRAAIPNLVQDENHTMQTHCINLDYFERAVVLRLEWLGFKVKKVYSKQYKNKTESPSPKSETGGCDCTLPVEEDVDQGRGDDESEGEDNDEDSASSSTVIMYQIQRKSFSSDDEGVDSGDDLSARADYLDMPKVLHEENNIFALQASEKLLVNFDEILYSVHRDCPDEMILSLWRQFQKTHAK